LIGFLLSSYQVAFILRYSFRYWPTYDIFLQKILWIGPTNYDLAEEFSAGATQLGQILEKASFDSCEVILVGSAACNTLRQNMDSSSRYIEFQNATVVWEFLKGRILPGIAALDKVSNALETILLGHSAAHITVKIFISKVLFQFIHVIYSICDK
jgi:hypothetical protein